MYHRITRILSATGSTVTEQETRTFKNMNAADGNLGFHFLKHVLREDERWESLLPQTFALLHRPDIAQALTAWKQVLTAECGKPAASWMKLMSQYSEKNASTPYKHAVQRCCIGLVERFPELFAEYVAWTAQGIDQAGLQPRHCVYNTKQGRNEGYIDNSGTLSVLVEDDRTPSPNHTHIPVTTFRKTNPGSDAARVLEMQKYMRNKDVVHVYSNEQWPGKEST